jgi:MFS transporter, DHA1 family, tetracycline resistance protein
MKSRKASLIFIFITVLVDIIGIGVIIPVLPELIKSLVGTGLSDASLYGGLLTLAFASMQFLFAPILGILSDQFGRRPILLISLAGLGVDYFIHAIAPTIMWLFVSRLVAGVCGASITVANAYIADISKPEEKAKNFGMIGMAFGLGFIIGPLIGGLGATYGVNVPFYIAGGLSILNFIYGYFVLPESLPKKKRRKINWANANPIASLTKLRNHKGIFGLIFAYFLLYIAAHALQSTWNFYTMYKFDWNVAQVGYSLAIVGLMVAIVQGGLVGVAVKTLGEKRTVIVGFLMWFIGMTLFAFAPSDVWLMIFLVPYVLGGIANPTIAGIISNQVPETEQGELQGSLTSLMSVSSIIGPVLMTTLFSVFTSNKLGDASEGETAWLIDFLGLNGTNFIEFAGAPFIMGAFLIGVAAFFAIRSITKMDFTPNKIENLESPTKPDPNE